MQTGSMTSCYPEALFISMTVVIEAFVWLLNQKLCLSLDCYSPALNIRLERGIPPHPTPPPCHSSFPVQSWILS